MTAANDNGAQAGTAPVTTRPCPICGRAATAAARPFCSKRCADVDLHRWLGGRYVVPGTPDDGDASPGEVQT